MSDQLLITEPEGTVCVPAATLARIVVRAAELADGARVRRPRRGVDVEVAGGSATVTLRLAARYGTVLPQVAEDVQRQVATALEQMCGIEVASVDVAIEELV
jgi:uncharacterized alkaline shock family protein YloU